MLELINIKKDYLLNNTPVHALKDLSINFRPCEFASILGPSGCGKTTLLNIIGGLDRYTSGNLIINGISTRDFTDQYWDAYRNSEIGFVFQSYNLIPHLSVLKNVELALNLSGLSHSECTERSIAVLKKVGMEDHLNKKPHQLSGGQMQRVSIARALVNNPRIILADEPTGALDSELGEQVMQVLKEVAQDKLVIMVTHNDDLAYRYSTRIIKIKDGAIVDDTNPFVPENPYKEQPLPGKKRRRLPSLRRKKKEQKSTPFKFTEMKFSTAMGLSWKNLITKIQRTSLTTIASSIGIIGMGLVLALSNGINLWMTNMKKSMLASVPIGVYEYSMNYDVMTDLFKTFSTGSGVHGEFPDDGQARLINKDAKNQSMVQEMLNTMTSSLKFNDISEEFMEHLKQLPEGSYSTIHCYYGTRMNLLYEDEVFGGYRDVSPTDYKFTSLTSMAGSVLGNASLEQDGWNQLNSVEYMQDYYDVLYGKYPTQKEEIVLIVNENNEVSRSILHSLGYNEGYHDAVDVVESDGNTVSLVDFSGIVGHKWKLVSNDDYFIWDHSSDTGFHTPTREYLKVAYSDELDALPADERNVRLNEIYQSTLQSMSEAEKSITLEVVGVLRVKESAPMAAMQCNFCFTPELGEFVMQQASQSEIAKAQKRLISAAEGGKPEYNVFNEPMPDNVEVDPGKESLLTIFDLLSGGKKGAAFNKFIGADTTPVYINIYASSYEGKDAITAHLDKWNTEHGGNVKYFDVTEMFIYNISTITELATLALIAVAAISLLVSSIMIAIIISNSVTERTREIGILRSIGAKKTDILLVFIAEAIIIGALGGALGIALTYALAPALSSIVASKSGIAGLAVVNPIAAVALFGLSIVLAVISGLIPSLIASHKNVVDALRSD